MRSYARRLPVTGRRYSRGAMRQAAYQTAELPAPVGGLNTRDSIADMPVTDAVSILNFWVTPTEVALRDGDADHVTGANGEFETLMVYNMPDGTSKMFGALGTVIYDVTLAGAVGAAVVTGLQSARWQWINFSTSGGSFLYAVNGIDSPLLYNGTTWTAITGASSPAITGVTTTTLININAFKTRIWFVQKDTLLAWYLPTSALGGAAASFDFRPIFKKGGYLVAMATWTIDGGSGVDDYAVFITSQGEVAVYQGTDPASASTFALRGVYNVANPIGRRCFGKLGGDVILINRDGLLPLSKALQSDRVNTRYALTDKINSEITSLTALYGGDFGWQVEVFPQENMLILNVPVTNGAHQFCMNTITGAWTEFSGWDAHCFARMGESVYYGTTDTVKKIWGVPADSGANIEGTVVQAFSKFGTANNKHFKMARPIFFTNGLPVIAIATNVNYQINPNFSASAAPSSTSSGTWDVGLWDTALWGGEGDLSQNWQTPGAIGYTAGLAMRVRSMTANFRWQATQYVYEVGAVL